MAQIALCGSGPGEAAETGGGYQTVGFQVTEHCNGWGWSTRFKVVMLCLPPSCLHKDSYGGKCSATSQRGSPVMSEELDKVFVSILLFTVAFSAPKQQESVSDGKFWEVGSAWR